MNYIKKTINSIVHNTHAVLIATALLAGGCLMQSCDDDDEFPVYPLNRPNALVTLKSAQDGSDFYMQLDDSTRLTASNVKTNPYGGKEVRAFINYRLLTQPGNRHDYEVYVNWIDSVLTKNMAANLGQTENANKYGQDPVEILRDWTVSEDGYMTIHFRTQWAPSGTPHYVNLVATSGTNPYDITFYHNAQGVKGGYWGDGVVAFRLDQLPDTKGKTVDLTLHWTSFSGEKSVTFKYCTRKGSAKIDGLSFAASGQFEKAIK